MIPSVGLFDRKTFPANTSSDPAWAGITGSNGIRGNFVKGFVEECDWSVMQSNPDDVFPTSNQLTTAVTQASGAGMQLKWRQFEGQSASSAIKALGVGPVNLVNPLDLTTFSCPAWWELLVIDADREYWIQWAARYNQFCAPLGPIREVSICAGSSKFGEPDVHQNSNAANRTEYANKGCTEPLDIAAQHEAMTSHLVVDCISSRAFNPYQNPTTNTNVAADSIALMDDMIGILGAKAGLGQNSLRFPGPGPNPLYDAIYPAIQARGAAGQPTYIQTANTVEVGDLYQTCLMAAGFGVLMIELPGTTAQYTAVTTNPDGAMSPAQFDVVNGLLDDNYAAWLAAQVGPAQIDPVGWAAVA